MGAHVGVGGVEGGLPRPGGVWGKPDQRDVGDNGAAAQGRRPAEIKQRCKKARPVAEGRTGDPAEKRAGPPCVESEPAPMGERMRGEISRGLVRRPTGPPVSALKFSTRTFGFAGPQAPWPHACARLSPRLPRRLLVAGQIAVTRIFIK